MTIKQSLIFFFLYLCQILKCDDLKHVSVINTPKIRNEEWGKSCFYSTLSKNAKITVYLKKWQIIPRTIGNILHETLC